MAAKTAPGLRWNQLDFSSTGLLPIAIFLIVFVFFSIFARNFFLVSTALNLLLQTSTLTILAIGEMMVLVMGCIDLSVEAVVAFGGIAFGMFSSMGMSTWQAMAWACILCGVFGLINGFLVARLHLPSFIITFAMAMLIPGISVVFKNFMAFLVGPARLVYAEYVTSLPFVFKVITQDAKGEEIVLFPGISWIVIIMVITAVFSHLFLAKTRFGRYAYLIGNNPAASLFSGVKVVRMKILAFVFSSVMAGLTGILISTGLGQPAGVPNGYVMIAIECAMIGGASLSGGTGSVWGTVVGSFIIGTLTVGLEMTYWNQLYLPLFLNGLIFLGVAYLDQKQKRNRQRG